MFNKTKSYFTTAVVTEFKSKIVNPASIEI